jgi:hypothetical protein
MEILLPKISWIMVYSTIYSTIFNQIERAAQLPQKSSAGVFSSFGLQPPVAARASKGLGAASRLIVACDTA